jgi:[ribosomal protein S5]-alanine N-acetyltransferase
MTGAQQILRTERLTLEPLARRHAEAVVDLFADPALSAYLAADFSQRDQAEAMVQRRLAYDGPPELGHWVFVQPGEVNGEVIGIGSLRPSTSLPGDLPEISWYLSSRYTGRGLATEAVRTMLRHALIELRLTSVWALVHEHNEPSLRLARRLGFLQVGTGVHWGALHYVQVALPAVTDAKPTAGPITCYPW